MLSLSYDDPVLKAACERILLDERGHVAFHRATLGHEFAHMPAPARAVAVQAWRCFVSATAAVVAYDHREVLELADVSRAEFAAEVRERTRRLADAIRFAQPSRCRPPHEHRRPGWGQAPPYEG